MGYGIGVGGSQRGEKKERETETAERKGEESGSTARLRDLAKIKQSKLTSLTRRACKTTSVRPLSCREESSEGSWKMYPLTTSVAKRNNEGP